MKHDKAMLKKLCENCYFGDGDYRDAMKAYAEHHAHSIIDETDDLKKRIAELEEQRAVFIELVKAQHCK